MVLVEAPGKLLLSGEWSILEKGASCIILAVDANSSVKIAEGEGIFISSKRFGIKKINCVFNGKQLEMPSASQKQKHILRFVRGAIEICLKYLKENKTEIKGFFLSTDSKKHSIKKGRQYQKIGFGSSAAVTVATIGALLELHGQKIEKNKDTIYKLATIAHFLGQGKIGSGFDIASSTYGGVVVYKGFDKKWLEEKIENSGVKEVVGQKWPGFFIENLKLPNGFEFVVGFSGLGASTTELVKKMQNFKETKKEEYHEIINSIKKTTTDLIEAIKVENQEKILELIHNNRLLLKELGEKSFTNLETPNLTKIIDVIDSYDAAGKFSGAGGGDSAVGVCFSDQTKQQIQQSLKEKGLNPVFVNISHKGVLRVD